MAQDMPSPDQSHVRRRSRLKLTSLVAAVVLIGAACSGSDDPASTSQVDATGSAAASTSLVTTTTPATTVASPTTVPPTTTTLPPVVGAEWQQLDTPFDVYRFAVGGDTLWALSKSDFGSVLIHSTTDGSTWDTYDPLELGVELDPTAGSGIGSLPGQATIGATSDEVIVMIGVPAVAGVSADNVSGDVWVLRGDGTTWDVQSPEDSGIDQRLEGSYNFRFNALGDTITAGSDVHTVVYAQWWKPYSTSGSDFGVVSWIEDGPWITTSSPRNYELGEAGRFAATSVVAGPGGSVVIIGNEGSPTAFGSRTNHRDGNWESGTGPLPDGFDASLTTGLAAGPNGFVAVGSVFTVDARGLANQDAQLAVWTSAAGVAWDVALVDVGDAWVGGPAIMWTGERYFLCFGAADEALASVDGVEWTPVQSNQCPVWTNAVAWRGGLVVSDRSSLMVSPPLEP